MIQPLQLPLTVSQVRSKASETEPQVPKEEQGQPKLPNLAGVLYRETYDEFTREKRPVVLASHCWSSRQTLFVGCRGGQLLSVDFDTGVAQVLANPQLTEVGQTSKVLHFCA